MKIKFYRDESFASKTGLTLNCRNFGLTSRIHLVAARTSRIHLVAARTSRIHLVAARAGHVPAVSFSFQQLKNKNFSK